MDLSKIFVPKKRLASRPRDFGYYPLRMQNIVATAWGGKTNLPMIKIAESLHGRLAIRLFPACVSRCKETGTVNIIFSTGQIVIAVSAVVVVELIGECAS
jgi:TATA-box binding protein (TBP) (component of TFIID and TFIIIB)